MDEVVDRARPEDSANHGACLQRRLFGGWEQIDTPSKHPLHRIGDLEPGGQFGECPRSGGFAPEPHRYRPTSASSSSRKNGLPAARTTDHTAARHRAGGPAEEPGEQLAGCSRPRACFQLQQRCVVLPAGPTEGRGRASSGRAVVRMRSGPRTEARRTFRGGRSRSSSAQCRSSMSSTVGLVAHQLLEKCGPAVMQPFTRDQGVEIARPYRMPSVRARKGYAASAGSDTSAGGASSRRSKCSLSTSASGQ